MPEPQVTPWFSVMSEPPPSEGPWDFQVRMPSLPFGGIDLLEFRGRLLHGVIVRLSDGRGFAPMKGDAWRGLADPSDAALADAWDHLLTVGEGS